MVDVQIRHSVGLHQIAQAAWCHTDHFFSWRSCSKCFKRRLPSYRTDRSRLLPET